MDPIASTPINYLIIFFFNRPIRRGVNALLDAPCSVLEVGRDEVRWFVLVGEGNI
jgi:hypothetical protein